jgi:creatinine amidohydrolase
MLRIRPELVGDYKAAPSIAQEEPYSPAHRAWITKDRSTIGHIGHPAAATAEKGEILFQLFSADLENYLNRLIA